MFAGHSGKNKLLAAQLFAHELSVDLFQIDLDRIVSKYVGDTEKNLDALFKAAEASDAVLTDGVVAEGKDAGTTLEVTFCGLASVGCDPEICAGAETVEGLP